MTDSVLLLSPPAVPVPRLRDEIRISPFHDEQDKQRYLLESGGTCFVVNESMRDLVLSLQEGPATLDDLSTRFRRRTGKEVSPETLSTLLETRLPRHLFAGNAEPAPRTPFTVSFQLLRSAWLQPLTSRLAWLFNPWIVVPVLAAFVLVEFQVLPQAMAAMGQTLVSYDVLGLFFGILAVGLIHELGHATACARYGCPHGGVGFGLYLAFPAFYADVTKAWRLPARQRAVVDLGGLYFQCILMIPLGLMAVEHQILLLLHVIWLLNLMMLMTLNPVFKMDGYWLLSDLSGLRNLHQRMEETLVGAVWKLRGKQVAPSMQQTVTGARRKILYAYTGLALVYYLYLLPLLFRAIVGVVLLYPARAYDSLAIVGGFLRSGETTQALFAVGHFIHISIWPVLLGVFLMRFVSKLVRGLVARIGEGIRCLVRGLCTCEQAPSNQAAVPASQVEESRSSSVSGG